MALEPETRAQLIDTVRRFVAERLGLEVAAAKLFASEMVGRVADHGIERFCRDMRIFRIYEGASQIQRVVIARETLKRGG